MRIIGSLDVTRINARCALVVAAALFGSVWGASAATIPVGSTADDTAINGNCTLREAVLAANGDAAVDDCPAGSGADVITLPAGIYVLTQTGAGEDAAASGDLDLTDDVDIQGAGAASTIIDGNASDRVLDVDPGANGITVAFSGITVRNGGSMAGAVTTGGGVRNAGALSIADSVITANTASSTATALGGGVRSTGTLSLDNSVVSGNTATASSVTLDPASALGGGIAAGGATTIVDSTIGGNTASTGFSFAAQVHGGGIFASAPLTITGTTIRDNTALVPVAGPAFGGGIATTATLSLTNSTVSGNLAQNDAFPDAEAAGALLLGGNATIEDCTIADNQSVLGAAVATIDGAVVTFRNSILADNGANSIPAGDGGNCDTQFSTGTIVGNGYNLEDADTCGFSGTDQVGVDPLLGPLQDNGGPTLTHLPGAGSPALEGGSPAVPGSGGNSCAATDQRGIARPQLARCDIGSVEIEDISPCGDPPLSGCDVPGKSLLLIKDKDADGAGSGDKLIWKWLKGPATAQDDFGDPTATANYSLCIYAGTAAVFRAEVPAAGTCGVSPCWKTVGDKGYKRTDTAASSAGIKKILLKGSTGASSKILFKGQGAALDLDAATLPLGDNITVQVSNSENANCWQGTYAPASVKTNSETVLKARTP